MRRYWVIAAVLVWFGVPLSVPAVAAAMPTIPSAPSVTRPIVDETNTLTSEQIDSLASKIGESRNEKDYQVGILMVDTLDGYPIEDYSIQVARAWGIGEKSKNNGVLLLIAKNDHLMRIEVGSGLEGDLTDIQSSHIINDVIAPEFRKGDFYQGITNAVESIAALVTGKPDPHASSADNSDIATIIVTWSFVASFILIWLSAILGRSKSWWAGGVVGGAGGIIWSALAGWAWWSLGAIGALVAGGLFFDWIVSRNYKAHTSHGDTPSWWAGGGWGGGSSGGGGGSFGGGGFSGGGSSGSW